MNDLTREVFGDNPPEYPKDFTLRVHRCGRTLYFRGEDVAELLDDLGQHKTARHLRGQIYGEGT